MLKYQILLIISFLIISCQSDYNLDKFNKDLKPNSTKDMILIPEGKFIMGSDNWIEKGSPKREITLKSFYIDKYEVSNYNYNSCVNAKKCQHSIFYGLKEFNKLQNPVVGISFDDALNYCKFLNKRLPTEEEWEKAARGPNGNIYPWGNNPPKCDKLSYGAAWSSDCKNNPNHTSPINSFKDMVSYYGVYNMSGNVWEWTDSEYIVKYFYKPKEAKPTYKVIKGGSFGSKKDYIFTYSRRWERAYQKTIGTGFRCVKDL